MFILLVVYFFIDSVR